MNRYSRKILLTDVDGVLLDFRGWYDKLPNILSDYEVQHTAPFAHLSPAKTKVEVLEKFKQEHWSIIAVTSCYTDFVCRNLRQHNLDAIFGKDFFENVHHVGFCADKTDVYNYYYEQTKGAFSTFVCNVDDHLTNCVASNKLGIPTYFIKGNFPKFFDGWGLAEHIEHHNKNHEDNKIDSTMLDGVRMFDDWQQIYDNLEIRLNPQLKKAA